MIVLSHLAIAASADIVKEAWPVCSEVVEPGMHSPHEQQRLNRPAVEAVLLQISRRKHGCYQIVMLNAAFAASTELAEKQSPCAFLPGCIPASKCFEVASSGVLAGWQWQCCSCTSAGRL